MNRTCAQRSQPECDSFSNGNAKEDHDQWQLKESQRLVGNHWWLRA